MRSPGKAGKSTSGVAAYASKRSASRHASSWPQLVEAHDDVTQMRVGQGLADMPVVVAGMTRDKSAQPRVSSTSSVGSAWPASHCPAAQWPHRLR